MHLFNVKYRSHRKHLLAREAEAASWNQRRQVYGGVGGKREVISPWPTAAAAPIMVFYAYVTPNAIIPRTNCFSQPLTTVRSLGCPIPGGIPPHGMYKADFATAAPGLAPFDFHPSKESIDAAIGDVLSKPWLPLPLGLKAPAIDSVMGELHKQGVSDIPP
ncbi:glucokinase [Trifolium repens]|nr:glucokinase [Trifolium repens]